MSAGRVDTHGPRADRVQLSNEQSQWQTTVSKCGCYLPLFVLSGSMTCCPNQRVQMSAACHYRCSTDCVLLLSPVFSCVLLCSPVFSRVLLRCTVQSSLADQAACSTSKATLCKLFHTLNDVPDSRNTVVLKLSFSGHDTSHIFTRVNGIRLDRKSSCQHHHDQTTVCYVIIAAPVEFYVRRIPHDSRWYNSKGTVLFCVTHLRNGVTGL